MNSQFSFIAMALVIATMVLGFATIGRLPMFNSQVTAPVHLANSSGTGAPPRIYCYSGIKGEPGSLYRGWICLPEHSPVMTN